jgi:predicted ATPase
VTKKTLDSRLLARILLRNYKSIAACDVRPTSLSFLVGPNGSGKSNFLDALRFVSDSLRFSLDHALRDRGGIGEVRRRSSGHPTHFGIRLEFSLAALRGHYAFIVGSKSARAYSVQREECFVLGDTHNGGSGFYAVENGKVVRSTLSSSPAASRDRLYLVNVSGMSQFRPLYDALSQMGFYNLNPESLRDLQPPDPGELLNRDGSNIASVLSNLTTENPELKKRIEEYLGKVVPGISGVDRIAIGPKETLEFRQDVKGSKHPWRFFAANMSDGTLRALGVLVALFQVARVGVAERRLVGIEEPESALHPAAAGVLRDSLEDASAYAQILVTSHSPDVLDDDSIPDDSVLAVVAESGDTKIGRLDEAGRSALRDRLFTAGELLRMDQLRPDPRETSIDPDQLDLFGPVV